MGITALMEGVTAAASVGMGCGTCCGSGVATALYGYLTTHMKNMKQTMAGFAEFFLGRLIAVVALCVAASFAGSSVMDGNGLVFGVKASMVTDGVMLLVGIWLLAGWIRELREQEGCGSCRSCGGGRLEEKQAPGVRKQGKASKTRMGVGAGSGAGVNKDAKARGGPDADRYRRSNHAALIGMGFGYGISPCAPLILVTGYAASLSWSHAVLLGAVFAMASTVSPMLFMLLVSGLLAGKMYREIPRYLAWFRLGCYLLLVMLSLGDLAQGAWGS